VEYTNLVDCCVRSQHFAAADVLVAADMLVVAIAAACDDTRPDCVAILANPSAVEALVSALASLMKRAANCIRLAGSSQSQPPPQAGTEEHAAYWFAAAAHHISGSMLEPPSHFLHKLAKAIATGDASSSADSSRAVSSLQSRQQHTPSLMLLAVLLARSLVVLADAMQEGAAVAGSTPAQLFAR
jgi:hypothetical protein